MRVCNCRPVWPTYETSQLEQLILYTTFLLFCVGSGSLWVLMKLLSLLRLLYDNLTLISLVMLLNFSEKFEINGTMKKGTLIISSFSLFSFELFNLLLTVHGEF